MQFSFKSNENHACVQGGLLVFSSRRPDYKSTNKKDINTAIENLRSIWNEFKYSRACLHTYGLKHFHNVLYAFA